MKVILDGKEIYDDAEVHQILKNELKFPDYYGGDFAALCDCLTVYVERPVALE
jgi:ribonuclease inhibitor